MNEAADCDDDDEHRQDSEELAGELPDTSFGEAVTALDLDRYVAPESNAESNVAFQVIDKRMVLTGERKKQQASFLDFFKSPH